MTPRELILSLCVETGDLVADSMPWEQDEAIGDFLSNHSEDTATDVAAAADGDVKALIRVRTACGLPIVT